LQIFLYTLYVGIMHGMQNNAREYTCEVGIQRIFRSRGFCIESLRSDIAAPTCRFI